MKQEQVIQSRKKICKQLAVIAKSKHITQEQLSELTGLHRVTINRMFSGRYAVPIDVILKVCKSMKVELTLN